MNFDVGHNRQGRPGVKKCQPRLIQLNLVPGEEREIFCIEGKISNYEKIIKSLYPDVSVKPGPAVLINDIKTDGKKILLSANTPQTINLTELNRLVKDISNTDPILQN